jgi:hypothetical protein
MPTPMVYKPSTCGSHRDSPARDTACGLRIAGPVEAYAEPESLLQTGVR